MVVLSILSAPVKGPLAQLGWSVRLITERSPVQIRRGPLFPNVSCNVKLMKEKTVDNVHEAFVGEAKAYQRLLMFAKKAEEEELPQIAHLFRAVAAAEGVHSRRHFVLLESVSDTQTNLERAFQSETTVNGVHYPRMIQEAELEGEEAAALVFSQARDVEAEHAKLYKRALNDLIAQRSTDYYVCTVCGHVAEREPPENCPVCGAQKSAFEKVP
jgi:rubrerythrin